MAETQHSASSLKLGSGGRITDPALLKELEHIPTLQLRDWLKLAIYFSASPTNAPVGKLLKDIALERMLTDDRIAPVFKKVFLFKTASFLDNLEDIQDGKPFQPTEDSDNEDPQDLKILHVIISNIGFVIGKLPLDNGETAFFVIGVSPAPDELPAPDAREASKPTSPK